MLKQLFVLSVQERFLASRTLDVAIRTLRPDRTINAVPRLAIKTVFQNLVRPTTPRALLNHF